MGPRSALCAMALLAGALPAGAWPAGAQGTPATATSPLRPCCTIGAVDMLPVADSLAGVLRSTGLASSVHEVRARVPARRVVLAGARREGAWHRPQEAAAVEHGEASSAGWQALGAWTVAGRALWRRQREYDVRWRNTSDAYLGTPYVWADAEGGTWRGDQVELGAAVGSPVWRRLRVGLGADYAIGQGARQNASRPLYRRRVLELTPALTWSLGTHALAGGITRGWHREDLEVGGGAFGDPTIYRLRGISTFDRTQLITAERAMLGGVHGITLGHAWQGRAWSTTIAWRRRTEADSVRDGIARPEFAGGSRRVRDDVRGLVRRSHARGGFEGSAAFSQEAARGTDPIFRAVNQLDDGTRGSLRFVAWSGSSLPSARWLFALDGTQQTLERHDVVSETRWSAPRREFGVEAFTRQPLYALRLVAGARAAASHAGDTRYGSGRPTTLTPILAADDFSVVSAPGRALGVVFGLEWGEPDVRAPSGRVRLERALSVRRDQPAGGRGLRDQWRLLIELF